MYSGAGAFDSKSQYVHYDYFEIPMRPTVVQWMEIKTPVLTEGTYNVWICWRRGGENNKFKEQKDSIVFDFDNPFGDV